MLREGAIAFNKWLESAWGSAGRFRGGARIDLINPAVMPAVDSPEPGGPLREELARLLIPLVRNPRALRMSLTVYDPALDPERTCARQLIHLLDRVFVGS